MVTCNVIQRLRLAQGSGRREETWCLEKGRESSMSQHSSLKSVSRIAVKRNVLKRFERIDVMKSRGQWKEGDRGLGLPKTKHA